MGSSFDYLWFLKNFFDDGSVVTTTKYFYQNLNKLSIFSQYGYSWPKWLVFNKKILLALLSFFNNIFNLYAF